MSIYTNKDGKRKLIATAITDHSQLTGNDAYGAHPINAIRGLSILLRKMQETDQLNADEIEAVRRELNEYFDQLQQALAAETERATQAEEDLQTQLDKESLRAKTEESRLDTVKVEKIIDESPFVRVYAIDTEGEQTSLNTESAPTGETLAFRTTTGCVKTAAPAEVDDSTNKGYVDTMRQQLNDDVADIYHLMVADNFIVEEVQTNGE